MRSHGAIEHQWQIQGSASTPPPPPPPPHAFFSEVAHFLCSAGIIFAGFNIDSQAFKPPPPPNPLLAEDLDQPLNTLLEGKQRAGTCERNGPQQIMLSFVCPKAELALQHGGFCTTLQLAAKGPLPSFDHDTLRLNDVSGYRISPAAKTVWTSLGPDTRRARRVSQTMVLLDTSVFLTNTGPCRVI